MDCRSSYSTVLMKIHGRLSLGYRLPLPAAQRRARLQCPSQQFTDLAVHAGLYRVWREMRTVDSPWVWLAELLGLIRVDLINLKLQVQGCCTEAFSFCLYNRKRVSGHFSHTFPSSEKSSNHTAAECSRKSVHRRGGKVKVVSPCVVLTERCGRGADRGMA